ncbi:unnamed protein product [Polarella glacialis]|uniref:Uncharacterized protein n=1 Tax=Polarella glacialis TaxID=89957 RepID=A0A813EDY6_POLGL|nr:unnamed protein product [Polarella glacialis]|mmetsp:Transcript_16235/g.25946  ORF Transcript_16235/g.25946 Transcript_16235/m.25946 type:complete len:125 (-) Transcript_16235:115-489(-)
MAAHVIITLAERHAQIRQEKLEALAVKVMSDLKKQCLTAHELGRRELTWGSVVPGIMVGCEEDMDDVLVIFAKIIEHDGDAGGFNKIEWCKARAPTQWVDSPARFGSHMQIRVHWGDNALEYLS